MRAKNLFVLLLLVGCVNGRKLEMKGKSSWADIEEGEEEADRILQLPGQPFVSFPQFSGYVTVNEVAGRALFYWLTEAADHPQDKPLVVWFNGGPGCSSIGYGASAEIGPFRVNEQGSGLSINKYSWNALANLLFLEAPAGVGFSYTNRSSDLYDSGDPRTAKDSLQFLVRWLERFPRYKKRELYLTGESYAGHYVPQLAKEIILHNELSQQPINLKGIMIGNPDIDNYYDNLGTVAFWWSHGMISDETYEQLIQSCDFRKKKASNECDSIFRYATDHEFGNIDQYNIYAPSCSNQGRSSYSPTIRSALRPHKTFQQLSGYDPCYEYHIETYYNRPDVQEALHANRTKIPYRWAVCSHLLYENWKVSDVSILPIYRQLIAANLKIWIYSGDFDSVVPFTATKYSLAQLNPRRKNPWYPWYVNEQVGGWTEVFQEFTFAIVRGAGHEVAIFKPASAQKLFKSFLKGELLPAS